MLGWRTQSLRDWGGAERAIKQLPSEFELKSFQRETIRKLAGFLEAARFDGLRAAFENMPKEVPGVAGGDSVAGDSHHE